MTTLPSSDGAVREAVGDILARGLADLGVSTVFGVISIHNMPILDAIARQGRIRFVPARGEAGAMNMADAYARVSRSLGVVVTSTGTAAGNAAGSQVEALTAGSPVLHITTQVDRAFMDRDRAAIHDVPRQADMLKAISKSYLRVWEPRQALDALIAAAHAALSAPSGPVTLEIPVDVQRELVAPRLAPPRLHVAPVAPDPALLDQFADRIMAAKRPMLWLGGGARAAIVAATALLERGFGAVTSTNGRAVVPEDHPRSLGAFNMTPEAQDIYQAADLMLVVGSRLRGNETRNNLMQLPHPLLQIDAEPTQAGRNYPVDLFLAGDARLALEGLLRGCRAGSRPIRISSGCFHGPGPHRSKACASCSVRMPVSPTSSAPGFIPAVIPGCAMSRFPTARLAIAMSDWPRRISASTRSAAASARALPWASAPRWRGRAPRR